MPPLTTLQLFDAAKLVTMVRGREGTDLQAQVARAEADVMALGPRDAIEAKLVGLFLMTTEAAGREFAYAQMGKSPATKDAAIRAADKLTRTAVALADAMDRRRRPAEQRIIVEKLAVGGRVVVGTVAGEGRGGG